MSNQIKNIKQKTILIVVFVVVLVGIQWVFTHSFISVVVQGNPAGSYLLVNQFSGAETTGTFESGSFNKFVRRGSYEVLVKTSLGSSYQVTSTKSFLRTTNLTSKVSPENERTFIGDEPQSCVYYINERLLSYPCDGSVSELSIHTEATPTLPTLIKNGTSPLPSKISGTYITKAATFVLLKAPAITEDVGPPYGLYQLENNGLLTSRREFTNLNANKDYRLEQFRKGFLIYSTDASDLEFWYYSSLSAKPIAITVDSQNDQTLKPYLIKILNQSSINILYSNNTENETAPVSDPSNKNIQTVLMTNENGKTQKTEFKAIIPSDITFCGKDLICLLSDNRISVYKNFVGEPSRKTHVFTDVRRMNMIEDKLIIVKSGHVLSVDANTTKGHIQYDLVGYDGCGVSFLEGDNRYVICVSALNKDKSALLINPAKENKDDIDKKVIGLLQLDEVDDLSIYGKYIFISPRAGEFRFNPKTRSFEPDPTKLRLANSVIKDKIDTLKIDRKKYRIINFLGQN
jgi:hypothetical protein